MKDVRKGQWTGNLTRAAFSAHFRRSFFDPAFAPESAAIARLEEIAWNNYEQSHKAPHTRKAGAGYADPDYDLSEEWLAARAEIERAATRQQDPASPSRALVICCAARNDGTCPGEISKTFRLARIAEEILSGAAVEVDLLDLSTLTSEYGRKIHPCKGCVSTAMPLCHWPCICYPNHSLGPGGRLDGGDLRAVDGAHGIVIVTPVYWYQAPSTLKLMIDRLVCADGGNPDPTSTAGKRSGESQGIWSSRAGPIPSIWPGASTAWWCTATSLASKTVRRALCDWLDWMGLIDAGPQARLDRMVGYYEPYALSHEALDRGHGVPGGSAQRRPCARSRHRRAPRRPAESARGEISRARGRNDCAGAADSQFPHALFV